MGRIGRGGALKSRPAVHEDSPIPWEFYLKCFAIFIFNTTSYTQPVMQSSRSTRTVQRASQSTLYVCLSCRLLPTSSGQLSQSRHFAQASPTANQHDSDLPPSQAKHETDATAQSAQRGPPKKRRRFLNKHPVWSYQPIEVEKPVKVGDDVVPQFFRTTLNKKRARSRNRQPTYVTEPVQVFNNIRIKRCPLLKIEDSLLQEDPTSEPAARSQDKHAASVFKHDQPPGEAVSIRTYPTILDDDIERNIVRSRDGQVLGYGPKDRILSRARTRFEILEDGRINFAGLEGQARTPLEGVLERHARSHDNANNSSSVGEGSDGQTVVAAHQKKNHTVKHDHGLQDSVNSLLDNWSRPKTFVQRSALLSGRARYRGAQRPHMDAAVLERPQIRSFHSTAYLWQSMPALASAQANDTHPFRHVHGQQYDSQPPQPQHKNIWHPAGIRAQLARWQELHGEQLDRTNSDDVLPLPESQGINGDVVENLTRTSNATSDAGMRAMEEQAINEERESYEAFSKSALEDLGAEGWGSRFLQPGDLVEIDVGGGERESIIAVHVRGLFEGRRGISQFLTMQGRWMHVFEIAIQYSIPGWIHPKMVEPLIEYLPNPETEADFKQLREDAYEKDISVPRSVSGPLIDRMVQFWRESQEIYRKHAGTLDDAHNILAHETDLRYGSLTSAATTLLRTPADRLPLPALFTVRRALIHAGFAFNVDRRSHRVTGYLQIRSKEQVEMLDRVRNWLRHWQDDLAATASMTESQRRKHNPTRGARIVYSFVEKARQIVLKSRKTRDPTPYGSIGPSRTKIPITKTQDAVEVVLGYEFTAEEQELVRFMESWACGGMFSSLPRVVALPPLVLQATELYSEYELGLPTGLLFLQELGTILPYENRVRFDQHLLLPSSQHSKPLQNLMASLMEMRTTEVLQDSMQDLRHDWGHLRVFCIDAASAHEIDDGISIEPVPGTESERWVHVHIANPTSHIPRDHGLAKMARHMGESIYMPERAYMMIPRWATSKHFSLANNRPCLTISARVDARGKVLEKRVRSGVVRNVVRLTYEQADSILGAPDQQLASALGSTTLVLRVGGDRPPDPQRKSIHEVLDQSDISTLRLLRDVAVQRQAYRQSQGGVFFDSGSSKTQVWQNWTQPGLAWDHPFRRGSRVVKGDPVIEMQSPPFRNWFASRKTASDVLVSEMMLMACELSASWCAERQIPIMYRGTLSPSPEDSEEFLNNTLLPAAAKHGGEYPMHLGLQYVKTLGFNTLALKPLKHKTLGLDHYSKVTSPLRRYGDMILHWQIEGALREEARTGRTLVTDDANADRSFLPFSANVLRTIMLGLQPREGVILKAKLYAEYFWISMLMFRAFHFKETPLPFDTFTCYIYQDPPVNEHRARMGCIVKELNINGHMLHPGQQGMDTPRRGDTWECDIDYVDTFIRKVVLKPRRLIDRWE